MPVALKRLVAASPLRIMRVANLEPGALRKVSEVSEVSEDRTLGMPDRGCRAWFGGSQRTRVAHSNLFWLEWGAEVGKRIETVAGRCRITDGETTVQ
jgi:hypothetical protein